MARLQPESVVEMLARLSTIDAKTGCHLWTGKVDKHGYAQIGYRLASDPVQADGKRKRHFRHASTVAYEVAKGLVPDGLEVSHLCDNPICVNPEHLIAETHAENLARRPPFDRRKYKGFCKRGHVLPPIEERNKNGSCPICYAEYQAAWRTKKVAYNAEYAERNRDAINAKRRERRNRKKEIQ